MKHINISNSVNSCVYNNIYRKKINFTFKNPYIHSNVIGNTYNKLWVNIRENTNTILWQINNSLYL